MTLNSILDVVRGNAPSQASQSTPIMKEEDKKKSMFDKYGPDEALFQWAAAGKIPTSSFNPKFLRMFMIIGIVIGILLALMQDFGLLFVIGSVIFFYYVLHNKYIPVEINYEISKYGFKYGTSLHYWFDLRHFFFTKRGGQEILIIDTNEDFAGRLIVLFKAEDRDKIFGLLKERAVFLEVEPKSSIDKAIDFVSDKFDTNKQ